jgi:ABC-2 type transport system permease protein
MQWILIKNNFKLILRRKWILLLIIVTPVLIIGMLAGAFKDLMASYEGVKEIKVGYQIANQSVWQSTITQLNDKVANQMHFQKYEANHMQDLFENGACDVFVVFGEKDYTVFEPKDKMAEGLTIEYCLNEAGEQIASARNVQPKLTTALQGKTDASEQIKPINLQPVKMPGAFQIASKDYYGIIYIVFFSALGIITISSVFSSERKNKIGARYGIAPVPKGSLYLGKLVPRIVVSMGATLIAAILATVQYEIHWGNLATAFGIMALFIITTSCFDVLLCYLCKNLALATGIVFSVMWAAGFAGGSFETYIYSGTPQWIKDMDPVYYVNRTLVESSVMGHSDYTIRCIIFLAAIATLSLLAGVIVAGKREGEVSE